MKKIYWLILAILWALLTLKLTTTPNLVVAEESWLNIVMMNGAHFLFFGIQAVLFYFSFPKSLKPKKLETLLAVLTTSLFGYYIEVLQKTIPGRSYDLVDWSLDTIGAIIFVLVIQKLRATKL